MKPPAWTSREATIVVPARRTDLVEERLDGEVIFSDPRNGAVFQLNPTAQAIWRRCDGRTSTRAIADALRARWEIDAETALDDVEQVVTLLAESDLLQTGASS